MTDKTKRDMGDSETGGKADKSSTPKMQRRDFVTKGMMGIGAGLAGTQLIACGEKKNGAAQPPQTRSVSTTHSAAPESFHVPPGQLDDYYGFWSGGQSGEIRVVGVPSMRELKRIPVFNRCSASGWGGDDFSKALLGGKFSGDTHHVHLSYTHGTYDGRYVYVNDKAGARLARVRLDTFAVDHITFLPNSAGTHGIFPQRHKTGLVLCNSEFRLPMPNDGTAMEDELTYAAMHTAVDGETMEVKWQVMVEGNLDLCATDYEGNYSFATCYNSEGGAWLEDMMAADQDYLYVFHLANIEEAVKAGKTMTVGKSKVPVVDARGKNSPYVQRIPVPKSPHGVNVEPRGKYAIVAGKLSPTCSVVEIAKLADLFAGKLEPADCIVARPEVGLGPLHTCFDGKGFAYTSIFIDSMITKWDIAKAIEAHNGADVEPIVQKLDVHYQVGHINASMSETKDADGKWLIALCKFSKDRFLNVGPLHGENDQLIDISGDTMKLMHDGPTAPEPHDCVLVRLDLINPVKISPRTGPRFDLYNKWAKEDGVNLLRDNVVKRKGKHVRVYMTSMAPEFGTGEIKVKSGDIVQVILTNQDEVEDLSHGFCMTGHDVNFLVNPQDTNSMTFVAGEPGLYWFYCPWFCHALHLEMRGRMYVEA
ncbi:MAG: nitrous-oxide reductase [Myxococcales bacterium]|nr:nitrous-oxide reductase [Myxococcales bacterium]